MTKVAAWDNKVESHNHQLNNNPAQFNHPEEFEQLRQLECGHIIEMPTTRTRRLFNLSMHTRGRQAPLQRSMSPEVVATWHRSKRGRSWIKRNHTRFCRRQVGVLCVIERSVCTNYREGSWNFSLAIDTRNEITLTSCRDRAKLLTFAT